MNEVYILQWFRRHGTICVIKRADTYYKGMICHALKFCFGADLGQIWDRLDTDERDTRERHTRKTQERDTTNQI